MVHILDFPPEITQLILSFCSVYDFSNMIFTCSTINAIVSDLVSRNQTFCAAFITFCKIYDNQIVSNIKAHDRSLLFCYHENSNEPIIIKKTSKNYHINHCQVTVNSRKRTLTFTYSLLGASVKKLTKTKFSLTSTLSVDKELRCVEDHLLFCYVPFNCYQPKSVFLLYDGYGSGSRFVYILTLSPFFKRLVIDSNEYMRICDFKQIFSHQFSFTIIYFCKRKIILAVCNINMVSHTLTYKQMQHNQSGYQQPESAHVVNDVLLFNDGSSILISNFQECHNDKLRFYFKD